jgi:hypothetical protein
MERDPCDDRDAIVTMQAPFRTMSALWIISRTSVNDQFRRLDSQER